MLPLQAEVDLGAMAIKGYLHYPELPQYCSLTIRLFSFIIRIHVEDSYSVSEMQSVYSAASDSCLNLYCTYIRGEFNKFSDFFLYWYLNLS